jgi:hypothetical protein
MQTTLILRAIPNLEKPPEQYTIDLLDGSYVLLCLIEEGVWAATEHRKGHRAVDRGLFGTPTDAVEVFKAEVTARIVKDTAAKLQQQGREIGKHSLQHQQLPQSVT